MNESPAKPAPAPAGGDGGAASRSGLLYAAVATALFSTSSVFMRWAAPLSPFEIAFWRMAVAAADGALLARLRGETIPLTRGTCRASLSSAWWRRCTFCSTSRR